MGKAVYFYATEKELNTLVQVAQDKGLLAISSYVPTEQYCRGEIKAVPPTEFNLKELYMYLIPKEISVEQVFYLPTTDPSESYLCAPASPVIEFDAYHPNNHVLPQNRIYTDYYIDAPDSKLLYNAYNRMARYITKWPKAGKAYIAPETYELAKNKEIELDGISV